MRYSLLACLAAGLLLTAADTGLAQPKQKTKIERIRVGFPGGAFSGNFKAGAWAPVYVSIMAGSEGLRDARVVFEATDSDDVRNSYTVPLRAPLRPHESVEVTGYTKPSAA